MCTSGRAYNGDQEIAVGSEHGDAGDATARAVELMGRLYHELHRLRYRTRERVAFPLSLLPERWSVARS
ncbi:hypothetical protein Q1695_004778 [Nippostrongylus brasiliensis]|nr:hypothetical protein Q1695_004778 [Nippostrongylus brasiliensis]